MDTAKRLSLPSTNTPATSRAWRSPRMICSAEVMASSHPVTLQWAWEGGRFCIHMSHLPFTMHHFTITAMLCNNGCELSSHYERKNQ
jgi:hypothetical protein